MSDRHENGHDAVSHPQGVTLLETAATSVSALLILSLIAVLLWDAAHPDKQPVFTIDLATPTVVGAEYRIPATVHNRGDKAAKSVVVHLELVTPATDSVVAESDLTIDWLPGESSRDIVGLFARSATGRPSAVRADVRGYVVP